MVFKIYQDREKISDTGNAENDYHVLFPQTVPEAIIYKNDFTNKNNLKSVIEYILENKSCVVVSEDEPTDTVGDTHWMKIIGTYNNGTIGNVYLFYTLKHILRNHDDTNNIKSENIICKANVEIIPPMKEYPGYLAETPEKVIITENGQIVECYYDEQQYTISYVLNGGINSNDNPANIYYTEEFTLKNPTKEHYNFNGWYTDNGFKKKISKLSKIADNTTLYAKFDVSEYGITYVLNDGVNNSSNPNTITYFDNLTLEDATKFSFYFDGWYAEKDFINKVETLSNTTADITLYAKFTEMFPNTISNLSIESGNNSVTITYSHPTEYYGGTTLIYKEGNIPTSISDGTVVEKFLSGTTINNLTNGTTYGFSLFNHNQIGNYKGDYLGDTATPTSSSSGGEGGDSGGGETDPPNNKIYLYKNGDECTSITGGWHVSISGGGMAGTCTKKDTYIEAKTGGKLNTNRCNVEIRTGYGEYIEEYKSMCIKYSLSGNAEVCFCIMKSGSYAASENKFPQSDKITIFADDFHVKIVEHVGVKLFIDCVGIDENELENKYIIPESTLKIYEIWVE